MEVSLNKRIKFIWDFAKVKPIFINGNVINIEQTHLNYGVTLPDKIGQDVYTYSLYPKWLNGEYKKMFAIDYEYKLAIPGYGTINVNINYVMYPNN